MYFPYLRAKQFDLAAIQEVNEDVYQSEVVIPIIEPVGAIKPIQFKRISDKNIPFVLVVNPVVGDFTSVVPHTKIISTLVKEVYKEYKNYWLGFTIQAETTLKDVERFIAAFPKHHHAFIHYHKFKNGAALAKIIAADAKNQYNILSMDL